MKSQDYFLISEDVKLTVALRLKDTAPDGKVKVTFSAAGDKSSKQRGLQWMWNTDVSLSGKGGKFEDTKDGVHLVSKYKWAIPIFCRDDSYFNDLWTAYVNLYGKDSGRMKWFIDTQLHTEKFNVSQMAEFLTDYRRHYLEVGVELTIPVDPKLLYYERNYVKD